MDRGGRDNIPYQELPQCDCSEQQSDEGAGTDDRCDKKCCGEKSDEEKCCADEDPSAKKEKSNACKKSCCGERLPEEECCGQNKQATESIGKKCCDGASCSKSDSDGENSDKKCCDGASCSKSDSAEENSDKKCCDGASCSKSDSAEESSGRKCCDEVSCSESSNDQGASDEKCCDKKCCDGKKAPPKRIPEEDLKPIAKPTFQLCTTNESEELESCCYVALEESSEIPTWNINEENDGNFMTTSIITTKLRVQNVCCGKESDLIKSTLDTVDGVKAVTVNTVARTAMVRHSPITLPRSALIRKLNELHLGVSLIESGESPSKESMTRDLVANLALQGAVISLLLALYIVVIAGSLEHLIWHKYVAIALICVALLPIARNTFSNWRRKIFVDMNVLVLITSIGIMFLGEWFETCTILIIFLGAEILQELCFYKVRKTISGLMVSTPRKALLTETNKLVDIDDVEVGTRISICEGEYLPLDGVVVLGSGSVDESSIIGESAPVLKKEGDHVYSCTILQKGYFEVRTIKTSSDSAMAQISQMVLEAQGKVTKTEEMMKKFAKVYTPLTLIAALFIFLIPLIVAASKDEKISSAFVYTWGKTALTILLVACPCALLMAVPMPMVCSVAAAARNGILVKGGMHIETLAALTNIVFDKTGTLTEGTLLVNNVKLLSKSLSANEIMEMAVALEKKSCHPVANALIYYHHGCITDHIESQGAKAKTKVKNFTAFGGLGMTGTVDGYYVAIGNLELMEQFGIECKEIKSLIEEWSQIGQTVVSIAIDNQISMVVGLSDIPRATSREATLLLKALGIHITMLTGDNKGAASYIGRILGLGQVMSAMKPKDKLQWINEKRASFKNGNGKIAMIGDGINDVPSLKTADVGIAVATCGTALAMDSSDVILMNDNIAKIPCLVMLSRYTRVVYIQNIVFALVLKFGIFVATFLAMMPLWLVVLADVGALILVILSGLRPLFWKGPNEHWM